MRESSGPDPPAGFHPYTPAPDTPFGFVARGLAGGWLLAVIGLGALVWLNQDHYSIGAVAVVALVTTVVHELVHAAVGWLLGLELTAGFDIAGLETGPYILTYGEFQTRRESALLAAAPTLVLAPVFVLLMVVGSTATALAALAALFVNTLGAVGDLRVVVTTLQLPPDALEYHTSSGEVRYYVRAEAGSSGR
ncbi:DUF3267 domain-containing protein [Halococcus sp. AFM35]|uniref:DUF3267 domain-containing protein n=1 Tax=Halococcus sp. AFM35 TaxID=3421653 RepID=UPI003EBC7EAD